MTKEFSFRKLTHVPKLSLKEREWRWGALRQEMSLKELDCLLIFSQAGSDGTGSANLRYITHVATSGVGIFPLQGEPVVFGGLPHTSSYYRGYQDWVADIRSGARPDSIAAALKEKGCEKGKIGVVGFGSQSSRMVPETIPYSSFLRIQKLLPEAVFSNESSLPERLRMIKSDEELAMIEKAAELANLMFRSLVERARPGNAECQLYAGMIEAAIGAGGEMSMILMDAGKYPLLHGRSFPYSQKPLEKGDMVVTEWHSNYGGYQVGVEHSLSLGEPDARYREIHKVCEEVFDAVMKNLKPGVTMEKVIEAMRKTVEQAGMTYVEVGLHGHGLGSPEFPTVVFGGPNCLVGEHPLGKMPPIVIRENMVFGINIDINNPKWRKDSGLMAGDTVVVTRSGARKLTSIPVELTVT
ncbi:MAG: Xaa-Pro peptidase family protein [Dehalococcoidia bacterium]|nr:Xaa-Pro peptidase family protein [Dehalococcoidia bacterium]